MKNLLLSITVCGIIACGCAQAKELKTIQLNDPDTQRGDAVMTALKNRKSTREFSTKELSLKDLSDLCWAANGINRPESGKRTAPSAMNKQDIKVSVCTADGSYLYNPQKNTLEPVSSGDVRPLKAPVCLILVSDTSSDWGAMDAGIVSQNISLFCAGTGMATVPRGSMDKAALKKALKLTGDQTPFLNHPVGYFK